MTQTLTFKNMELVPVANFLNELNLKNKASRGRTKLIKLLADKNDEYNDDRKEVSDPYFKDGELLKDADGKVDEENEAKAIKALNEIEQETSIIDFTEYSDKLKALYESVIDYPNGFSDNDAIIYDLLMDQFETVFENNESEEEK